MEFPALLADTREVRFTEKALFMHFGSEVRKRNSLRSMGCTEKLGEGSDRVKQTAR
jgi:hypothetical protein